MADRTMPLLDVGLDLTVDEAEMRVGLFVPPSRPSEQWSLWKAPLTGPIFAAARDRMRARGLGNDEPWAQEQVPGTLKPLGEWALFVDHAARASGTCPQFTITTPEAETRIRLIPGYGPPVKKSWRRYARSPLMTAEHLRVPAGAGEEPLPVRIESDAPPALIDRIVRAAYAGNNGELVLDYDDTRFGLRFGPDGARGDFSDGAVVPLADCSRMFQTFLATSFKEVVDRG